MKKVRVLNVARGIRLEGLLLGVGLTLFLLGALGMVIPGPGFIPMERRVGTISPRLPYTSFEHGLYLQMFPSQYVHVRLHVQEGGNTSQLEVRVFSNYQALSPVNIQIILLQAINQTDIEFLLSWANATHDQPLPFTGFWIRTTSSDSAQFVMTYIFQYYGDFTYFGGQTLIILAAIPFWGFIILAYLRRRRMRKTEQKDAILAENDPLWE